MHHQVLIINQGSITDGLTALAALVAAGVAVYGVREWKRQLKGKTDYDIARRYLRASLKLRDALRFVRNPFVPLDEIEVALKEYGFESEEYRGNNTTNRAVYASRWKKVTEAWTNLEVELVEAEISWGSGAIDAQKELDGLVRKLRGAINIHLNETSRTNTDDLIYDMGEKDKFSKEVSDAIKIIEKYLEPHLK